MNADAPLSSGEELGENPAWLDRSGVKALFEAALRAETGADLAFYPQHSVAGRLRPGAIRSGDIYSLESWQESVEVVDVHGSHLSAHMVAKLPSPDRGPDRRKMYAIATTTHAVRELTDQLGKIEGRRPGAMVRDLTIAYLKRHGFEARG